jgi:transglutaminase-like putative cysteine protease
MKKIFQLTKLALGVVGALAIGVPLYALPAALTLPPGPRPGLEALTLPQAARRLQQAGKTGWPLVEAARRLVAERMRYSRRNSFDTSSRAFARGYGYCTQQAYALAGLLARLGFESRVVHAFQNRFPDGRVGAHAWVRVTVGGETRDIDSLLYDPQTGEITFRPRSKVQAIDPVFKLMAWWGATAVNAHRYYLTGSDGGTL